MTIAEHFSISQPNMRKIFREYTGVGISDYVTNIKMEKAMPREPMIRSIQGNYRMYHVLHCLHLIQKSHT